MHAGAHVHFCVCSYFRAFFSKQGFHFADWLTVNVFFTVKLSSVSQSGRTGTKGKQGCILGPSWGFVGVGSRCQKSFLVSPAGSDREQGDAETPRKLICRQDIYFPCKPSDSSVVLPCRRLSDMTEDPSPGRTGPPSAPLETPLPLGAGRPDPVFLSRSAVCVHVGGRRTISSSPGQLMFCMCLRLTRLMESFNDLSLTLISY